jgi:hypothetical protein
MFDTKEMGLLGSISGDEEKPHTSHDGNNIVTASMREQSKNKVTNQDY